MKRASCVAVGVFLSFLWIPIAIAAPNTGAATQKQRPQVQTQNPTQSGQNVRPKREGIDWKNKVLKERDIKKRAAARRNVLMQQAEKQKPKTPQNVPPPAMNP